MDNGRTIRRHGAQLLARGVLILALCTSGAACTTATAGGCGAGIVATVALTAVAIGAGGSRETQGGDAGAALAGAGLIGAIIGCTSAAVADGMARADERYQIKRGKRSAALRAITGARVADLGLR